MTSRSLASVMCSPRPREPWTTRPTTLSSRRALASSDSSGLKAQLGVLVGHRGWIATGETRATQLVLGTPRRRDERVVREIRERGRADVLADLLDALLGRDHLRRVGEIDPVEALPDHRR